MAAEAEFERAYAPFRTAATEQLRSTREYAFSATDVRHLLLHACLYYINYHSNNAFVNAGHEVIDGTPTQVRCNPADSLAGGHAVADGGGGCRLRLRDPAVRLLRAGRRHPW